MTTWRRAHGKMAHADDPQVVAIGRHVEIELLDREGGCERFALDVVPHDRADFAAGRLGSETPLAMALLGQRVGAQVPYNVGDLRAVRILSVSAAGGAPDAEVADRRAILAKAVSRSEQAEAARFSLTVDLKWGGTDPSAIEDNWE
jgi:hypothetical protein